MRIVQIRKVMEYRRKIVMNAKVMGEEEKSTRK